LPIIFLIGGKKEKRKFQGRGRRERGRLIHTRIFQKRGKEGGKRRKKVLLLYHASPMKGKRGGEERRGKA